MKLYIRAPWAHFARALAAAVLITGGSAQAQTAGCAPPEYAQLAVVDTGLPVVQIWTDALAPVLTRETYINGCMRITDGRSQTYGQGLYHGAIKIRGRGNSSWNMPKKGYRLKLPAATGVLDMPASRDFVLIANYADKTLLRNNVAFEISRRSGFAWTPRMRHADFYLNNEFLGNYQLGEKIEVEPSRVALAPMTAQNIMAPDVEGGYLLQVEYPDRIKPDEPFFVNGPSGYRFIIESPSSSVLQPAQQFYIASYVQALENSIFAGDANAQTGIASRLDMDSMVSYYLVQELLKNKDAAMGSSVYLYKDRGALLTMGPLWDFDISAGNIDFYPPAQSPEGWYLRNTTAWFDALMRTPEFKSRVIARWKGFKSSIGDINRYIDAEAGAMQNSQKANFQRWPILDTYVWPNQVVTGSYDAEVKWYKDWLKKRIAWMDKNIKN